MAEDNSILIHPSAFVHPTAFVDDGAILGEGTKVWHYSHVMGGAQIGRDVSLGQNVFVANRSVIGDGCRVQNNVSVYEGVELEEQVFCGPSMVFTNVRTPRAFVSRKEEYGRTLVRRGATLGANCTIVCGNEIGEYAMVAAGAVVTHEVAPHRLVAGVPAQPLGWVCLCGERLSFNNEVLGPGEKPVAGSTTRTSCLRCGEGYVLTAEKGLVGEHSK